jgi:hypothetical protein
VDIFKITNNKKYLEFYIEINKTRAELRSNNYSNTALNCYICKAKDHLAPGCNSLKNKDALYKLKYKDRRHKTDKEITKIYDIIIKRKRSSRLNILNNYRNSSTNIERSFTGTSEDRGFFSSDTDSDMHLPFNNESNSVSSCQVSVFNTDIKDVINNYNENNINKDNALDDKNSEHSNNNDDDNNNDKQHNINITDKVEEEEEINNTMDYFKKLNRISEQSDEKSDSSVIMNPHLTKSILFRGDISNNEEAKIKKINIDTIEQMNEGTNSVFVYNILTTTERESNNHLRTTSEEYDKLIIN